MDLDELAQYEPTQQDLRCLQNQLFSSLVLKEFSLEDIKKGILMDKNVQLNCYDKRINFYCLFTRGSTHIFKTKPEKLVFLVI